MPFPVARGCKCPDASWKGKGKGKGKEPGRGKGHQPKPNNFKAMQQAFAAGLPQQQTVCKNWIAGKPCSMGSNTCFKILLHPIDRAGECRAYAKKGVCGKQNCPFGPSWHTNPHAVAVAKAAQAAAEESASRAEAEEEAHLQEVMAEGDTSLAILSDADPGAKRPRTGGGSAD